MRGASGPDCNRKHAGTHITNARLLWVVLGTSLPEWELLDFCREHGIVLLASAALGHGMSPKVLNDPVIRSIAERVHKTPAQVALAWAVQRGTAFLTTSTRPDYIQENF
jgi:diketogulonate reductase-like aldo/keto reductase